MVQSLIFTQSLQFIKGRSSLWHQRQRPHEGLPQAEDQGRQGLRREGPDKGESRRPRSLRAQINEMEDADWHLQRRRLNSIAPSRET